MRESFGGSAREEAAKQFNKDLKKAALNDAFRAGQSEEENNKLARGREQEYDLEAVNEPLEIDEEKKSVAEGVNKITELGNEIELPKDENEEKLELDK